MAMTSNDYAQALHKEIDQTPTEHLAALLSIVHTFRESVSLKSPIDSVEKGLQEALSGETEDISTLWDGIDVD
ncbi:hypothetical protein C2869_22275 (plasmid) [Saccharobesus litoralis]|uniref:Uncharacterized protein n=1 Tax=Saccharobesus litoralis TaxID=2172099 RepID=A0A2S0VYD4_9ALTE|nr:hypothetical protein [Saccharobesus litoralis]AWB69229.1 hypothetical protein C2869_22275 [Saccharobesus litoralis]